MSSKREKKFTDQQQRIRVPPPPVVPSVVSTGSWTTSICIEDFSLEGGEESDDDDNLAYRRLLESFSGVGSSYNVLTFSLTQSGGGVTLSLRVLYIDDRFFFYLDTNNLSSFSTQCLTSLLDYAESINVDSVYCIIPRGLSEQQLKSIIKSFQFMSFQLLHPSQHPITITNTVQYSFLKYSIHYDSTDSDEED